jgi:Flp pilus assembly protein TadG
MSTIYQNHQFSKQRKARQGAAASELALLAPLLVLITFGVIDAGQCINVSQIVNEASREGARLAARAETTDVETVRSAVQSYVAEAFPGKTVSEMAAAVTVEVGDSYGTGIPAGDLSGIESGTPVTVRVVLPYDSVRWSAYLSGFDGMSIETQTVMRRE